MIGLDTNILVRMTVDDDARQVALTAKLMDSLATRGPGYISTTVFMELCWVLSSHYRYTRAQIGEAMNGVLETSEFLVEQAEAMAQAVGIYQATDSDFSDCVIACVARAAGCEVTMTFDTGACKLPGMRLLR